jgi:predicted anti-sigma-YlaC factor YlaD
MEWVSLKFHLALCDACRNFSRQLGLLRAAMRRMVRQAENDGDVRLPEPVRERIAQRLSQRN